MQDKESELYIIEGHFKHDNEQATSAVIPSPSTPEKLEDHCNGVYDNSHHSNVRRSSDDREEDLFLEELNQGQSASLKFVESWYSDPREKRSEQDGRFEGRDDLAKFLQKRPPIMMK